MAEKVNLHGNATALVALYTFWKKKVARLRRRNDGERIFSFTMTVPGSPKEGERNFNLIIY